MSGKFAMCGKIQAQPGQGGALASILLEAAEACKSAPGCELYLVNVAAEDPDAVWVMELWADEASHAASLRNEKTLGLISKARPLIAGIEPHRLRPLGGLGYGGEATKEEPQEL
ncbi:antibiotic biosynthesis monooxygenase family protein [Paenibacillus sp.]|uniref:putative quinol monooxygenase n=1 Tax=Paenibacillus sp. TaxID=58172 RepID=UPI002D721ACD|nr:antibiotic biosynthesis monooxygenase family protein [Paenibacillus sp.]HZG56631.1 antibiotic biosynthesis monooxygenase family protein [Paenibacillus sp.]